MVCRGLTASDVPMTLILSQIAASRGPMAAFVAMGVVWGVFMASMPDLKAGLGVSDGQLGRLLLAGSVMAITMMLLAPRLGGWLGRAAVPLGTAMMGLGVVLPAQAATPLDVWRDWCVAVEGQGIEAGHFIAEENPKATLAALLPFLERRGAG